MRHPSYIASTSAGQQKQDCFVATTLLREKCLSMQHVILFVKEQHVGICEKCLCVRVEYSLCFAIKCVCFVKCCWTCCGGQAGVLKQIDVYNKVYYKENVNKNE